MKLGMPSMVELGSIEDCCRLCVEEGLDFVEINTSFPQYNYHSLTGERLLSLSEEYGIFFTVHIDEMLNPFDFNPDVSECYFRVARETVRLALKAKIPVINRHLLKGVYTTLPDRVVYLNDEYFEEYLKSVRAFVRMCEEEIGDDRLKIAIENVDSNPFTPSQLKALEIFLESPVFGLTLDVGHYVALDRKDGPVYQNHRDKVVHMHLHDCIGKGPHLPLGTGVVDVPSALDYLNEGATCLIEVKNPEGLRESVKYLKSIGKM